MQSGHGKKRMNNNNNNNNIERAGDGLHSKKRKKEKADRLSSLPNDLIHKILFFISIKDTAETMVLSSRYRFIWITMPYLNFSTQDFPTLQKFSKFVNHFLSRRNGQIDVSSLNLSFRRKVTQPCVKKLMDYAFSHNIQQLSVTCLLEDKSIEFPLSLFSNSMSLKHLSLKRNSYVSYRKIIKILRATSTLELPALTTLYLHDVTFCSNDHTDNCVGLFSKCPNLKNLTLRSCKTEGLSGFSICHPGLSNLTLDKGLRDVKVVNVVAPQLENLTIRYGRIYQFDGNSREHVISAPNLASLAYRGYYPLHLFTDGFHCLKEADIWVEYPKVADAHQMVCLLQQLHNVKFLKLSLEIIELLSSHVELISHQPTLFVNLKSLTIYPKGKVNLSTEVKTYLLDSSPGATFTMFSLEEIIAVKDVASAQQLMAELRVLLEQEKANTKTIRANTNQGKATMESHNVMMHEQGKAQPEMKMQLQIGGNLALIESCWEDLSVQFEDRKAKACLIISKLKRIEGLLQKLPASNRAMIQPCFSSLCAEADIVMSKITDCMKIQCDENQSRLSVCFHELATSPSLERSS